MTTVSDVFTLKYGHSLELNRLELSDGPDAINFVGRAARNNGVTARVKPIQGLAPEPAGTITVALNGQGGAGEAFLQPFPYYTGYHVMILTSKAPMTEQEKLWWTMCISANRYRFGFGRQANRTLKHLVLPDATSIPTWVSLADTDCFKGIDAPKQVSSVSLANPATWHKYVLQDLFDIRKGKRLTKANMEPGDIPFIGAIDKNNGVSGFVSTAIHAGNTITVNYNGSVAEAFYQPVPFWCSDDVNVLYPKFNLSPEIALFICTVIRQEKYRYNYGRKWHLERMRESVIQLPAAANGDPDWAYMESFIKALPYSSQI